MSFIAYRKRKAIASGARRASDYVRRASQKLRASISGRPAEGQNDKANPVNSVNKDMMEMQAAAAPAENKVALNDTPDKIDAAEAHNFGGEEQAAPAVAQIDGKEEVANDITGH